MLEEKNENRKGDETRKRMERTKMEILLKPQATLLSTDDVFVLV